MRLRPTPEGMPLPTWFKRKMLHGSLIVGLGPDAQDDIVGWRHGRTRIDNDPTRSAIFRDLIDAYAKVSAATGKRILHFQRPSPFTRRAARVWRKPSRAVVDSNGEIFGLAAGGRCGPPSMTVAASAQHVADRRFIERPTRSA